MENPHLTNPDEKKAERWDDRTVTLLGKTAALRLAKARVLVVGAGGVGGYAAEMLARSGIGHITLIDSDDVAPSNINRQIIALQSTIGGSKTELFAQRFRDINPDISVTSVRQYVTPENIDGILDAGFDFVIDAIDTVAPKVALITRCIRRRIPIISSMGAGGRTDPTKVGYADLWVTSEDGLARAVRQRLKRAGIRRPLRVVASSEAPRRQAVIDIDQPNKRSSYGTLATIPAIFGIMLAAHVIDRIAQKE